MIGKAKFGTGIEESQRLLKKLDLLAEYNPIAKYDTNAMRELRRQSYEEIWRCCLKDRHYTFLLHDQSYFQFHLGRSIFSYSFYDCPFEHLTLGEFAREYFGIADAKGQYTIAEEYEEYLQSVESSRSVAPVRYDYDPTAYRPGIHPAAHLHIGYMTNVRIATDKVLGPHSFVLFIIRQFYPRAWEQHLFDNKKNYGRIEKVVRSGLEDVLSEYRKAADSCEMSLR